jgi:hypothetical protein
MKRKMIREMQEITSTEEEIDHLLILIVDLAQDHIIHHLKKKTIKIMVIA